MIAQSNVTAMLVGKDLNIAPNTMTRETLAVGQIGVFLVGSTVAKVDALTAGQRYSIALKNAKGIIIETPVITYGSEVSKSADLYAAPTQRIRAIGYNGTSGAIVPANSTNFIAHIFWKDNSKAMGQGTPVKFAAYYSSAAATQAEIAAGLVNNFNKNFARENPKLIKAEVLLDEAGAACGAAADTFVGLIGSKYITVVDTAGDSSVIALAAGDFFRIGTATTSPCYKITSGVAITGGTITLDTPLQAGFSLVGTTCEYITAAQAAAAEAGVLLTALATTDAYVPGLFKYDIIDFDVELKSEFGATSYSSLATPFDGSGTYWEVADQEWSLRGNRGETARVRSYPVNITLEATPGLTYDYITVAYAQANSKAIDRNVLAFGSILIATPPAGNTIHAGLKTVLGIS